MKGQPEQLMETRILLDFPGITVTLNDEALVLHSKEPLLAISTAVVGGGMMQTRYILNRHVPHGYSCEEPEADLVAFSRRLAINEPFVGLMTAASLNKARTSCLSEGGLTAAAIVTAGLRNTVAPGLTPPAALGQGTINTIVLVDGTLTPGAMVNAVTTATEVKAHVLIERGVRTREGHRATGTSTDALVVACTGKGASLRYGGPATLVGWLVAKCVRAALDQALDHAIPGVSTVGSSEHEED